MQTRNVPGIGAHYWAALSLASVFGANLGDFVSRVLHLGHTRGLLPLAVVFGAILLAERRAKASTAAYYWLAIVTLRTAATNLADFGTHDLRLGYGWVIASLAALLLILIGVRGAGDGVPKTDARYWAAMLTAGTLGTAIGDALAGEVGLGVLAASAVLIAVLAALLAVRVRVAGAGSYWSVVVAIRSAGTTVGDFLAHSIGLTPSTAITGVLLVGSLAGWRRGWNRGVQTAR